MGAGALSRVRLRPFFMPPMRPMRIWGFAEPPTVGGRNIPFSPSA